MTATSEREKLIRDTWAGVYGWPVDGPVLNVPIRPRVKPFVQPTAVDVRPEVLLLKFERGVEYSECGTMRRIYVECEGVRVAELIEPTRRPARKTGESGEG